MAKKKRRKPYDGDPMMVTKLSRWGTKAQGKTNERERAYKNRIHELETALAAVRAVAAHQANEITNLADRLSACTPSRYLLALRAVCGLSLRDAVNLGIDKPLISLCVWIAEVEGRGLSTGKEAT